MNSPYTYINNVRIINENRSFIGSLLIKNDLIYKVYNNRKNDPLPQGTNIINGENKILIPGLIDDQVHFREPGLSHKANIYSESKAAVAGGVTSFMDMPNTIPQATSIEILEQKFNIASKQSLANYSFYLGATNDNIEEIIKIDPESICGLKVFMGSSTGNLLVDNDSSLERIFKLSPVIIAVHCEDDITIQENLKKYKAIYGENIPVNMHPVIRSTEACYKSSSKAVALAKKFKTRLHLIHLSSEKELGLFENLTLAERKKISSEVCVHHLWFSDADYDKLGTKIKWNPAIKKASDRDALIKALIENKIDIIATDHAPHTSIEKQFDVPEKERSYFKTPSGGPMIQHSLPVMLELWKQNKISIEKIVEKMCHTPSDIFNVKKRGYIKEGYYADLVLIDPNTKWEVNKENILYKCQWSPLEGEVFHSKITHTFVNGHLVYENGNFNEKHRGKRLVFDRNI
ncbi:dihydroorotase [Bacteroidota bacterium]